MHVISRFRVVESDVQENGILNSTSYPRPSNDLSLKSHGAYPVGRKGHSQHGSGQKSTENQAGEVSAEREDSFKVVRRSQ